MIMRTILANLKFVLRSLGRNPSLVAAAAAGAFPMGRDRLDASLPVFNLKTVETQIQETHFLDRLFAWLSVGLYGITAYAVAR